MFRNWPTFITQICLWMLMFLAGPHLLLTPWGCPSPYGASLPWRRLMATPARSPYLASAATWPQKHWSYTPQRTLKYLTFLFVNIAEISNVSVLSSNQNEAYIGCQLKREILTWPDLANLARINLDTSEFGNNTNRMKRWDFLPSKCYFRNKWSS